NCTPPSRTAPSLDVNTDVHKPIANAADSVSPGSKHEPTNQRNPGTISAKQRRTSTKRGKNGSAKKGTKSGKVTTKKRKREIDPNSLVEEEVIMYVDDPEAEGTFEVEYVVNRIFDSRTCTSGENDTDDESETKGGNDAS